jgi:ABC-type lipoprotein export system ATPase subunit
MKVEDVCKVYHDGVDAPVLFDVDFELRSHEFTVIAGPSGSGKTTLLNLLGLLDVPTSGRILLQGNDVSKLGEDERARYRLEYLGFIFQFHNLLPEFDVLENALMPCRIRGRTYEDEARDRVRAMLQAVGLGDKLHSRPDQISGGQRQRVAVIRALANSPRLVLADEPTGSLDTESSRVVVELMREMNQQTGTAFLMVTHDPSLVQQVDRVIELRDGHIIGDDRKSDAARQHAR